MKKTNTSHPMNKRFLPNPHNQATTVMAMVRAMIPASQLDHGVFRLGRFSAF
jgi:hypothetical protein